MPCYYPDGTCSLQSDGINKICLSNSYSFSSGNSGIGRPGCDCYSNHCILNTRTKCCHKCKCKYQLWKGQKYICNSHENGIHYPAKITGNSPDKNAHRCSNNCHETHNIQCQSGTIDDPAENISAHFICTKKMSQGERFKSICKYSLKRIIGCNPGRKDGNQDQGTYDQKSQNCKPVI